MIVIGERATRLSRRVASAIGVLRHTLVLDLEPTGEGDWSRVSCDAVIKVKSSQGVRAQAIDVPSTSRKCQGIGASPAFCGMPLKFASNSSAVIWKGLWCA